MQKGVTEKKKRKVDWQLIWNELFYGAKGQVIMALIAIIVGIIIWAIMFFWEKMEWFNTISALLQYITVILALLAWHNTNRILKNSRKARFVIDSNDAILVISLSNDIETDVSDYISQSDLKAINSISIEGIREDSGLFQNNLFMDMYVNRIHGAFSIIKKQDMPLHDTKLLGDYVIEFRKCIEKVYEVMSKNSVSNLHVFLSAPGEMAAFLSPCFYNKGKSVIMYRLVGDKKYEPIGDAVKRSV